ncbi:MAG: peptidoglycan-binding protein LysM [Acidobacteriota bacterium]|nr:MAG: peptidoglycan-binding protein LysM [Acidobacteriota bacterium]
MGLIDFVKNAGAKLFGGSEEPAAPAVDPAEVKRKAETAKADALARQVKANNLKVEDLRIAFRDHVATVHGTAASQTEREKVVLVVGNVDGVGQVDDQLTVEKPEPEAQYYTVVRGDTLSKIAKQYYGNAMKYPVIFEANKPMLKDPDRIYPGQVLRIPPIE